MAASTNEATKLDGSRRTRRSPAAKKQRRTSQRQRRGRRKSGAAEGDANVAEQVDNIEYLRESLPGGADDGPENSLIDQIDDDQPEEEGLDDDGVEGSRDKERSARTSESEQVSFLAMYFREMANLDVLQPEEEFTAAREIEELEIVVWEELFSHAAVVEHLISVVEACMDNSLTEFRSLRRSATDARKSGAKAAQAKLGKAARRCAAKVRAVDVDKQYLEAVLADLVRIERGQNAVFSGDNESFSVKGPAFRSYLTRVRMADRAAADARNDFVKANLRLVVSIARRFNHGRMALADLIQEGNIGLMKAVERYDYRRGFRFSTYASWWIRHAISRALADKGREVRLPVHMIDAHHRLSKAKRELTAKLGRQPTNDELAEATSIAPDKIEKMRTYLLDQSFSLDRPVNDEDGRSFVEFLQDPNFEDNSPTDMLALQALTAEVKRIMDELKPIEADILRQRFGLDNDRELTLKQIGEKYNLSRERIRQLQEQALSKMRRALQRKDMM
ncbi:MAG: sigma-70 family RNA polymerase sigma factor [Proteobacteria bacterium]|nr:sigma-70 family RNA polymerase sigma factor [Pseudomonadota bacterium]